MQLLLCKIILLVRSQNRQVTIPPITWAFKQPEIIMQVWVTINPVKHWQEELSTDNVKVLIQTEHESATTI